MHLRRRSVVPVAVVALLLLAVPAVAKINPDFTPNHIVQKATQIMLLKLKPADAKGLVRSVVRRALKGAKPETAPVIDLTITAHTEHAKLVKQDIARLGEAPVLLFIGEDEDGEEAAFLHLGGKWIRLDEGEKKGYWDMDQISGDMEGTWAGGTDMFLKIVELLLKHPEIEVPIDSGCMWDGAQTVSQMNGAVYETLAVDFGGNGRFALHVLCSAGDRLFQFDAKAGKLRDVTAARQLTTKSRAAAWGDFNADGRLDLASLDGKEVTVRLQSAKGALAGPGKTVYTSADCVGLGALDVGVRGRAGILVSTAGAAVLFVPGSDGSFVKRVLGAEPRLTKQLVPFSRCLVADFDNDHVPDILQPASTGSLFYKGKGDGRFARSVRCSVGLGKGRSSSFVGDWDQDGLLDVFAASQDFCRLWHNKGRLTFHNMLGLSGEMAYISKPGAICGGVCDVNNDGLQDVLIIYSSMLPQVFFNRGFRSFGHARKLAAADLVAGPAAEGQEQEPVEAKEDRREIIGGQAGLVGDLNGDGAQDMILVLRHNVMEKTRPPREAGPGKKGAHDGEVWFLPRQVAEDSALCVRVALPLGKGFAGPLTVTGWTDRRCLGAWNVSPGTSEAFFGKLEAGEVEIRWQLPGGKPQKRTVVVEDKPVRIVIGAKQ